MRAAAILGLGSSLRDLSPFQHDPNISWSIGVPAESSETDVILILGGDGTVHRHLGQLVKLERPVLVIPCGSGNDFARALGLRRVRDSLAAWRKLCHRPENIRGVDLGQITALASAEPGHSLPGTRYFCCVGGIGLDAEIARRANQLPRWLRGHGGYALSLLGTLVRFAPVPMRVLVPHDQNRGGFVERHSKPTVFIAFANAPSYGGGMRIAPRAEMDDGKLDICLVNHLNRFKLLSLFPTVYFGRHLGIAEVEYFQATRLRLETETPLDVYADGEYVCRTPVEITIAPNVLQVIVQ
jgi:diacylglycerol kinase (ATP)